MHKFDYFQRQLINEHAFIYNKYKKKQQDVEFEIKHLNDDGIKVDNKNTELFRRIKDIAQFKKESIEFIAKFYPAFKSLIQERYSELLAKLKQNSNLMSLTAEKKVESLETTLRHYESAYRQIILASKDIDISRVDNLKQELLCYKSYKTQIEESLKKILDKKTKSEFLSSLKSCEGKIFKITDEIVTIETLYKNVSAQVTLYQRQFDAYLPLYNDAYQKYSQCRSLSNSIDDNLSPENVKSAAIKLSDNDIVKIKDRLITISGNKYIDQFAKTAANFCDLFLATDSDDFIKQKLSGATNTIEALARKETEELEQAIEQNKKQKALIVNKIDNLQKILDNEMKAEHLKEVNLYNQKIDAARCTYPTLFPFYTTPLITDQMAKVYCDNIRNASKDNYIIEDICYGAIRSEDKTLSAVCNWHSSDAPYNFMISHSADNEAEAHTVMSRIMFNAMLSLPIKKLKFTIVDLGITNAASQLTVNIDSLLYNYRPIVKDQDLRKQIDMWQERMIDVSKQCNNLLKYNSESSTILMPYEVVIVLDFPNSLTPQSLAQLAPIIKNGYKGGIFFIIVGKDILGSNDYRELPNIVNDNHFINIDINNISNKESYPHFIDVLSNDTLMRHAFAYINSEARKEEEMTIIQQDIKQLIDSRYLNAADEFRISVGGISGKDIEFRLDEINHVHSFILGKSGSGKSVFLHNIINNAILKYSPDSLELYLMDFKIGGVEFDRYKHIKHVRALLIDNSDQQITLEVLRNLYEKMRNRGELLRSAGASSLREYNSVNPHNKLPRMVIVADECHEIFRDKINKVQAEINAIISKIAKEGRSQGVHLIFATQTLANSNISLEILNNITNHYLLKCSANDSEKLVRDSSKITSQLSTGWLMYNHFDEQITFQAYYMDKDMVEETIKAAIKKMEHFNDIPCFFFSGKQSFVFDNQAMEQCTSLLSKYPRAAIGCTVDVNLAQAGAIFRRSLGDNMLVFGLNTHMQSASSAIVSFMSLMLSNRSLNRKCSYYIINCLNTDEVPEIDSVLSLLSGSVHMITAGSDRIAIITTIAESIRNHTASESYLLILGQERFREVKLETPIAQNSQPVGEQPSTSAGFLGGADFLTRGKNEKRTCKSELRYILENGPENGVHVILHIDKPSNLLFENVLSPQNVLTMFKHFVMFKSSQDAAVKLRFSDDLKLEELSDNMQRLRAYYYNDEENCYTLLSPYMLPDINTIKTLIK